MTLHDSGKPTARRAMTLRRIVVVCLALFGARPALAGWQVFGTGDGLPLGEMSAAAQDSNGVLWFGGFGVTRYDGVTWKTYTTADGLPTNGVEDVAIAPNGDVWVATFEGVSRFDGRAWRTYTTADGLPGNVTLRLLADRSGRVWALTLNLPFPGGLETPGGVGMFDGNGWHAFMAADNPVFSDRRLIIEAPSGEIWIAGGGLVGRWNGSSWRTYDVTDGLPTGGVNAMTSDRDGNIWVSGYGASRFDGNAWQVIDGLPGTATSMLGDREGRVWFGLDSNTGGGAGFFEGTAWHTTLPADGGPPSVASIHEDRRGRVWFSHPRGTLPDGHITRFDGIRWQTLTAEDGLPSGDIQFLLEDRAGNLWFSLGLGSRAVARYDGSSWRTAWPMVPGLSTLSAYSGLVDRNGNIWFNPQSGNGLIRFDGRTLRPFTTADGLPSDNVRAVFEDRTGALWFGTSEGVSRLSGGTWTTFTPAQSAPQGATIIAQDRDGNLWFLGDSNPCCGVSAYRFDGTSWQQFTTADGVPSYAYRMVADRSGGLWVAGGGVAARFDGANWVTVPGDSVPGGLNDLLADRAGNMWFACNHDVVRYDGTEFRHFALGGDVVAAGLYEDHEGGIWVTLAPGGVTRWDGTRWRTWSIADGLGSSIVRTLLEDRAGNLWAGLNDGGVSRFNGASWGTYSADDGLGADRVNLILEDRSGDLWFGTDKGVTRHEPDRMPPQTVVLHASPRTSASRYQTVAFGAAHKETPRTSFAFSFDGAAWTTWSSQNIWSEPNLPDGIHTLLLRSRDLIGNVDSIGVAVELEIDATPPTPAIAFPGARQAVHDTVRVRGTAADSRFREYEVELREKGAATWSGVAQSSSAVYDDVLCAFDSRLLSDGDYELRLSVGDTLGLTGTTTTSFIVDNEPPYANVTSPALVTTAMGGNVFSDDAAAHLYIPPHGLSRDTIVTVATLDTIAVPPALSGAVRLSAGVELGWGTVALDKTATLDLADNGVAGVVYFEGADSTWRRLGGTVDAASGRVSVPVNAPGRYALFGGNGVITRPGGSPLATLTLTPRVFGPRGGYANAEVAIGFTLGRAGTATVRVFSRSGRLIREVARDQSMGAGANVVRWDGRDRAGSVVEDGLYLVTVDALGSQRTQTLAVVR